ncbi:MAG TPA: asparagine synthase-related protein [Vicinamibacterales bacterium]|nr:asparagine synthase-related protein [Vicinamibacterales bacterium]
MGGIIGKLSFQHDETLALPVLEQMLGALRHRGAHGSGIYTAPGIALGWCGETPAPINRPVVATNDAGTVHVIADASLSNACSLRRELEQHGYLLRGRTDADLIAHAYDQWGDACVEHLRGPFTCAIWDSVRERLLLARDYMGVRPLFFALLHAHGVVFASEIRALLQDPGVGREWCPDAIDAYLALGYVPAPLTAYQRISKVEPAQRVIVDGHRLHVEQFWDLPTPEAYADEDHVVDTLCDRLRAAIGAELKDERIDGTLYSGGPGSAAILACGVPAGSPASPTAVSVIVGDDDAEVARSFGTAQHLGFEPQIEAAIPDVGVIAPYLAAHFDEPLADPAAISLYSVLVAARRHVGGALSGHGASALWAGYARHRVERVETAVRNWLGRPLSTVSSLAHLLQDSIKGARSLSHLAMTPGAACAATHAYGLWDDDYRRAIYTRGFAWQVREADPFVRHVELYATRSTDDPLDRALYVDARTCLPDSTLAIAERAALSAGVELRFPYLERELVEFAARVPSAIRLKGATGMHPLLALLSRLAPPAAMPPAPRRPATHPWLPAALRAMVPPILLEPRFDGRGIVSRPVLRQLWEEHCAGRRDHSHRLWALLMLEFWFRDFVDGDAADEPAEYAVLRAA